MAKGSEWGLFPAEDLIGTGCQTLGPFEGADEIVGIGEATLLADFADGMPLIGQQLPRSLIRSRLM